MKTTTTHTIETYKGTLEVEVTCNVWLGLPATRCHPGDDPEVTIERLTIDGEDIAGRLMAAIVERIGFDDIEVDAINSARGELKSLRAESIADWAPEGCR